MAANQPDGHATQPYLDSSYELDLEMASELTAYRDAILWGSLLVTGAFIPYLIWRRWRRNR